MRITRLSECALTVVVHPQFVSRTLIPQGAIALPSQIFCLDQKVDLVAENTLKTIPNVLFLFLTDPDGDYPFDKTFCQAYIGSIF